MIGVLVRNQNRIYRSEIFADSRESLRDLPPAQPRINQQPCATGGYESRVSPAAASEYADLDYKNSCQLPLIESNSNQAHRHAPALLIG